MGYSAYFSWYKNGGNYHPTGFHLRLFLFELLLWPVIVKNYSSVGCFLEGPIISRVFHLCSPFLQIYVERVLKEMKMLQCRIIDKWKNILPFEWKSNTNINSDQKFKHVWIFYFFQLIFFSLSYTINISKQSLYSLYIYYTIILRKKNK